MREQAAESRRTFTHFTISEIRYLPGFELPAHCHPGACFSLVLDGACSELSEGERIECEPSTWLFRPAGHTHANRIHAAGTRCINVDIGGEWLANVQRGCVILDHPAVFRGGVPSLLTMKLYREFRRPDPVSPLVIEGLALEILAEATRRQQVTRSRNIPQWLQKVRELLLDRFTERLDLSSLAASAGVHPVYLASAFRKHYGRTVGEHIRELRIQYARDRLADSKLPLAEIAVQAGFVDQSHFSNAFKRVTGFSPGAYRRLHRPR